MLDAHNITKLKDRIETHAVYILNPNAIRYLGLIVTWPIVTLYAQWSMNDTKTKYIVTYKLYCFEELQKYESFGNNTGHKF